jgi:hypothetical protein
LDFDDGLSDEGALIIVISDGTRVEHAGRVAIFRATEAQEKTTVPRGLCAQLAEQGREIDTDFEWAFIPGSSEGDFADIVLWLAEERPAVEGLRSEFMFGLRGVFVAGDANRHPQVGALIAGELQF